MGNEIIIEQWGALVHGKTLHVNNNIRLIESTLQSFPVLLFTHNTRIEFKLSIFKQEID